MLRTGLFRLYCAAVLAFLLLPIAAIVPLSFSSGSFLTYPLPGWSLRWYDEVFTGGKWLAALANSLRVGVAATALSVLLGTLAALGLARVLRLEPPDSHADHPAPPPAQQPDPPPTPPPPPKPTTPNP